MPTDPDAMWLLPVGYVRWKPNIDPTKAGAFMATDATDRLKAQAFRIYIGVVAGAVEAAAGVIRLKDRVNDFTPTQSSDLGVGGRRFAPPGQGQLRPARRDRRWCAVYPAANEANARAAAICKW